MRKIFTVVLIILMLSSPTRIATASDGGGIVLLNTVSAFTKPAVFTTIVLTSFFVVNTLFAPELATLPPLQRSELTLTLTATLTFLFFKDIVLKHIRYLIYALTTPFFYFQPESVASSPSATPEEAQTGLWSASNPDVKAAAVAEEKEKEKQELINKAVQGALRDPEIAKKYLEYSTPEVKAAVTKALENQAADRSRF